MSKKCVLILLDGLGDRSYKELGNLTPLQAAETPVLDRLATAGANGLYHAGLQGQALPSENAHFVMFGYDMADFPGRGALEALGAGIELSHQDVAILSHFVSLREAQGCLILDDDKLKASEAEAAALIQAVRTYEQNGVTACFIQTKGLFGVIRLQGNVSPFITDTDPIVKNSPLIAVKTWKNHADDPSSRNSADALRAYLLRAWKRLEAHPVNAERIRRGEKIINGLVTQRAGQLKPMTPFSEKYGLRGLSVSSGIIYWGLCRYVGIECEKVKDSDDPGRDIAERMAIARKALKDYDFIHVHSKAPDEAGHSKDPLYKKRVIEMLDKGIGEAIEPLMSDPDVFLIITADHSTPCDEPLVHSGETVPVIFHGKGIRRDRVRHFNETSAAGGALGCMRGKEFIYLMLNHLDRCKLHGLMDTPEDQPFWPGKYEPFRTEQ